MMDWKEEEYVSWKPTNNDARDCDSSGCPGWFQYCADQPPETLERQYICCCSAHTIIKKICPWGGHRTWIPLSLLCLWLWAHSLPKAALSPKPPMHAGCCMGFN